MRILTGPWLQPTPTQLVLDFSGVGYVDFSALRSLEELVQTLLMTGVRVSIANVSKRGALIRESTKLVELLGDSFAFNCVHNAVRAAQPDRSVVHLQCEYPNHVVIV